MKSTRTVLSSTTTNCSGLVSEPAPIWKVGKPPTVTARSSDHFTSLAVTGVPSWKVAFFFSLKVDRHVADVHVLGEFHLELVAVVIGRAVRPGLHLVADEAVVAIPRHLVARHVGADAVDVDVVRPAFGDDQQRLLPRSAPWRARRSRARRRRPRPRTRISGNRDASCAELPPEWCRAEFRKGRARHAGRADAACQVIVYIVFMVKLARRREVDRVRSSCNCGLSA